MFRYQFLPYLTFPTLSLISNTDEHFFSYLFIYWPFIFSSKETVSDFIFFGSKITTGGDRSHEIKKRLLLERKVMIKLDSILKSRHYFANTGTSSRGYGFSSGHIWM